MARKKQLKPSELELLILKVLWRVPDAALPIPVREVRRLLADEGRDLAHTTVITVLSTMVAKGFVKRTRHKNAFRFSPKCSQKDVHGGMLGDLLDRVFDGSAEHLVLALLNSRDVGEEEVAEIKRLINQKSKQLKDLREESGEQSRDTK